MKKKKKQIVKIDRTIKLSAINPLLSLTSVSIFSILLPGHSRVLTRRICPTIKRFFIWWSSPLFSWHWCLIQGWCCKEKLDVSHDKSREEKMAGGKKWLWIQVKYFSLKGSHYIIICFLFNYHYNYNYHCYFQYHQLKEVVCFCHYLFIYILST